MSLPLIAHSRLFSKYNGSWGMAWYVGCGDGTTIDQQNVFIDEMDKIGANVAILNLMNEELSTLFVGEYMNSAWDQRRIDLLMGMIQRLRDRGKMAGIAFFDGPASDNPKYPFLRYSDRHVPFMQIVTQALAPVVDVFFIGIETNRYASITDVEDVIDVVSPLACRMINGVRYQIPVSTHEQNVGRVGNGFKMLRRVARNAHFVGYETINHPHNGDAVSVADMVREVEFLVANSGGRGVWVMESNSSDSQRVEEQNNALAQIPGVIGVDGPMQKNT
ncbi:MAG: hypothetical protein WC551_13335 [Patescibacteria group bacterium]